METAASAFMTARKIRFGADVVTSEGERGTLASVIVEPTTGAAISAGVQFGFFGRASYVGFAHLTEATSHTVTLDVARDALDVTPPAGIQLTSATKVTLDGKRIGKLDQITFDAATRAPHRIVIARGAGSLVVISAKALAKLDAGEMTLAGGRNGATPALANYRPDQELREDVREAIERYGRMRVEIAGMNIQAIDGEVWLRGHVSSDMVRRLAEDLSRGVPGVTDLHNLLVSDSDLAASISSALARDPRTAQERIGVYPALGRVRLRGLTRTAGAREAAAQIAADGHGAREVVNELRVDSNASVLPVLAGVTGDEDMVPGGR